MSLGAKGSAQRRNRKRVLLLLVGLLGASAAVFIAQPLWAFDALTWAFPHILWRVNTSEPLVALSFDDGPAPASTSQVLAMLAKHNAHATFFLIGGRAAVHPEFIDRLRAGGHELGNHHFTEQSTLGASDEEFGANLARTESVFGLQGSPKLFRPPGGRIHSSQLRLAETRGYRVVLGSAYPYDPSHPPSAYIRWLVTKNLEPGVIVILHDGIADPSRMIAALDSILSAGTRKGFRFVTIGDLLRAGKS